MKKKVFALVLCLLGLCLTVTAFADELPGYAQYVEQIAVEAEESAAKEEADRIAGLSASELAAEEEAAAASAKLDSALEYIDGYADAIQNDPNNDTNIDKQFQKSVLR